MAIRFKCPQCQKSLSVKDELAGKKAACPVCKKGLTIPQPSAGGGVAAPKPSPKPAPVSAPANMEDFAAAAFADAPAAELPPADTSTIDFDCPFCGEELHMPQDQGGKQGPCPECKRIIKIPLPKAEKKKDWRELAKKGPSAALINLPEQLENAWGTEAKTRVSGDALAKAGATPQTQAKPVGVGGWVKRFFYLGLLAGVVVLAWWGVNRASFEKGQKDALSQALEAIKKSKAPSVIVAETHRSVGLVYIRKGEAKKALDHFKKALAAQLRSEGVTPLDQDLFLAELALAQVEMGGTSDQAISKLRYNWKEEVQKELSRSLGQMKTQEGKGMAMRDLASKLLAAGQEDVALSLASDLANGQARTPMGIEQVALLLSRGKTDEANKLLPAPQIGKGNLDPQARQAYTEGHARKKEFTEALNLATAPSPPVQRLETCVAVAGIAAADPKTAAEAKPFVEHAFGLVKQLKAKTPPLALIQTMRLVNKNEGTELLKEFGKELPADVRGWCKLAVLQSHLRDTTGVVTETEVMPDFNEREVVPRALAYAAIARHNARVGEGSEVRESARETADENVRPMIFIGFALGEQERRR